MFQIKTSKMYLEAIVLSTNKDVVAKYFKATFCHHENMSILNGKVSNHHFPDGAGALAELRCLKKLFKNYQMLVIFTPLILSAPILIQILLLYRVMKTKALTQFNNFLPSSNFEFIDLKILKSQVFLILN